MKEEDVVLEYKKRESIREVSRALEISAGVVRKCLIGAGIISTPRTCEIAKLREEGLSQKQIAEKLDISTACVNANTPYERGTYLTQDKTKNAEAIRRYRERMRSMKDNN